MDKSIQILTEQNIEVELLTTSVIASSIITEELFKHCSIKIVSDRHLRTVADYNLMMSSKWFYKMFEGRTSHILLLQTDAFLQKPLPLEVFDYEYIGAKLVGVKLNRYWFSQNKFNRAFGKLMKSNEVFCGNGGLSVRKIESFLKAFNLYEDVLNAATFRNEDIIWSYIAEQERWIIPSTEEINTWFVEKTIGDVPQNIPIGFHGLNNEHSIIEVNLLA